MGASSPELINGTPVTPDQKKYLEGFFAGLAQRGVSFADMAAMLGAPAGPAAATEEEPLIFEERVKREEHPLDSYYRLVDNAAANKAPDKEETFRFKWNGLFFLSPVKEAFMARLRIPGGFLRTYQLREIARAAKELTTGYIQVTTRANFQIRLIEPKDAPEFLRRIQSVGLHTRGAGADNIRNITANPTAGVDPHELVDVTPYVHELGQFILSHREFYDLPRKFNIALDGGGLVGVVEDTNDIGARAVKVGENTAGVPPGIWFRIRLGGATGHKAFANDAGILVRPDELVRSVVALVRVYIARGCRSDRKKARLKHLLEKMPLEQYVAEAEALFGGAWQRDPLDAQGRSAVEESVSVPEVPHSHVGIFPQKQKGLFYIGVTAPIGQVTAAQLLALCEIADHYGSGDVRLTVWQNFILPNIPEAWVGSVQKSLQRAGFAWRQSNVASGIIACTGNRFCKYASSDTKGHARVLQEHLEKRLTLDRPVNIHFTGCPHSCAQHYMGDIGLLATKVQVGSGSEEGYHITIGGGFGDKRAVGRPIFTGITHQEVPHLVEKMLRGYLRRRNPDESFQDFANRHDINTLQAIFTNGE